MILVSRNIKYNIRGGSIGEGASPSSTIRLNDVWARGGIRRCVLL